VATEIENRENTDNALRVVQIVLRHRGRNRTSRSHRNQRFYPVCSLRRPRDDAYRISTRTETSNRYQVTSPTLHSLVRIVSTQTAGCTPRTTLCRTNPQSVAPCYTRRKYARSAHVRLVPVHGSERPDTTSLERHEHRSLGCSF